MFFPYTNTNLHIDGPAEPPIDGRPVAWAYRADDTAVAVACPHGCGLVHEHSGFPSSGVEKWPVPCPSDCDWNHPHIPVALGTRSAHGRHPWIPGGAEYVLVRATPFLLVWPEDLQRRAGEIAAALGFPYRTWKNEEAA